jgi:hypothetical protein
VVGEVHSITPPAGRQLGEFPPRSPLSPLDI